MRRRFGLAAALVAAWSASAAAQEFTTAAVRKLTPGVTNQGSVAALTSSGTLGAGTTSALDGFVATDVAVADFAGDAAFDIAAVGTVQGAGRLILLVGRGDGTFAMPQAWELRGTPVALARGTPDLEGAIDLAVPVALPASAGGAIEVFTGSFLLTDILSGIDGDGIADETDDHGVHPILTTGGNVPLSVTLERLDGDTFADIAYVAEDPVLAGAYEVVVATTADGVFRRSLGMPGSPGVHAIAADVLNNWANSETPADGDPDIAVATGYGVHLFENDLSTAGGFSSGGMLTGAVLSGIALGDVTGDGLVDLITLNAGSGNISTNLASPAGGYDASRHSIPVGANPVSLALINFNNDGHPDVAVVNSTSVRVFVSEGSGGFTAGPVITAQSGANGLPLVNVRSVAAGRIDASSTSDDLVIVTNGDLATPGGIVFLSAAAGYDVVPLPVTVDTDCFDELEAELATRDAALTGTLTSAQKKEKKAIAKARAALAAPSASLAADLVAAGKVVKALAKVYAADSAIVDLLAGMLDCLAVRVRGDRDALEARFAGLPDSKAIVKAQGAADLAESLLANAGTASSQAAIAKLLKQAFQQVGKGGKALLKLPSFVVATIDGVPFASDFIDSGYGAGGGLIVFADDFTSDDGANFMEINLNLFHATGPGTYSLAAFPAPHQAYFAANGTACGFSCPRWDAVSGTVTITSEAGGFVDGTFAFDANRVSGTGVATTYVYLGRFHIKY